MEGLELSAHNFMKRYIAILNQNNQDAPVATVLENSLGPIVWTRIGKGKYQGTLLDSLPADKTTALCGHGSGGEDGTPTTIELPTNSNDYVSVTTKDIVEETGEINFEDGLLIRTTVDIRVYQ